MALLNYGEPQILELFKNTLPSRLYYMLYQIDDLRTAVETAKRLLIKEQLDKQKTGQSSASPLMKVSQEKSKKNEKGVTFGAMETIKRHDSIVKLTSLMNKLDMKLDRREVQYRPKIFQGRNRGCGQRQDIDPGIDPTVGSMVNITITIGEGEIIIATTMIAIIETIIETIVGPEVEAIMKMAIEGMIDMTIGPTIEGIIFNKTMVTKGIEIEV